MKNLKLWTLRYTLINVLYFVAFCTIHAYAAVFLLDKGFNNTQVGLALAISNILSVIGQPLVSDNVAQRDAEDRPEDLDQKTGCTEYRRPFDK